MFEKQAMLTKNNTDFFNKFSLIFREKIDAKSMQNHVERLFAQKSTKKHVWNLIFERKINS